MKIALFRRPYSCKVRVSTFWRRNDWSLAIKRECALIIGDYGYESPSERIACMSGRGLQQLGCRVAIRVVGAHEQVGDALVSFLDEDASRELHLGRWRFRLCPVMCESVARFRLDIPEPRCSAP